MILQKANIHGFGKLSDLSLVFHPRLNLFFGPNEAGKSTLQQALLHLLYGFYQADKARKKETDLLERFRPWGNSRYGGQVWYQLRDGRQFQVDRDFSDSDIPTHIFDALTGQELTSQFPRRRHGNIAFLRQHIGMDKDLFEATAFVRQAEVKNIPDASHVMNDIIGILDSGSRDSSARKAIQHLSKIITEIGTERATKRPLPQLRGRLQQLNEELEALKGARRELRIAINEKNRLDKLASEENQRRIELHYLILNKSIDQREKQLKRLAETEEQLRRLEARIQEYADVAEFPEEIREKVSRRLQSRRVYAENIEEKKQDLQNLEKRIEEVEKAYAPYQRFERVQVLMPFAEYESLRKRWIEANNQVVEATEKVTAEEIALLREGIDLDSLRHLQEINPAEIQKINELEKQIEQEDMRRQQHLNELERLEDRTWAKEKVRKVITLLTPTLTFLLLLISFLFNFPLGYAIGAGIFALGAVAYQLYRSARRKIEQEAQHVKRLIEAVHDRHQALKEELQKRLKPFGVKDFEQLMARRGKAEGYLKLIEEKGYMARNREQIEFQLLKYLQAIDIHDIDEDILNVIHEQYGLFDGLYKELQSLSQQKSQLEREIRNIKERRADNDDVLRDLLAQAGIEIPEIEQAEQEYEKRLQRRKQLNSLKKDAERIRAEIAGILASQSKEELRKELDELVMKREELLANFPNVRGKTTNKTLQQLQREFDRIDQSRQEHEQQLRNLEGKIETVLRQHRPQAEIEEELSEIATELQRMEAFRSALELARDTLITVSQAYHRNVVPFLNESVSKGMAKITGGRYADVKVNPQDLSLSLHLPEKNTLGSADVLSLGTQEQIYLLLRVALSRLLSENLEPVPLILDDPFVHFDHERMANMLDFLFELSTENQILLFTKEPFIREWCAENLPQEHYSLVDLEEIGKVR